MPEDIATLKDREGYPLLLVVDPEPHTCPACGDVIADPRDWWDARGVCILCGFTKPEEK